MYKIIALLLLTSPAFAGDDLEFKQDAYGPGVHSDQYGRAYTTRPDIQIKQNAYGLGKHSDQYGRPVTPKPVDQRRKSWVH